MNKDSKKKWRTYGMNTTRRDESKKKFYAEVKDILEKKHRDRCCRYDRDRRS